MLVNVPLTLFSGQPSHFIFSGNGKKFCRAYNNKIIWVQEKELSFTSNNKAYFNKLFRNEIDLKKVYEVISTDSFMKKAVKDFQGLRVTKNDLWETTACFILSSNNSLQNIRNSVQNLMKAYGNKVDELHEFPSIDSIAKANLQDLKKCKCGFRTDYLKKAAQTIQENNWVLSLKEKDSEDIQEFFLGLKGIGPKITQAILLFGYGFSWAFPIDTWIEKGMQKHYFQNKKASHSMISEKAKSLWHPFEGFAQQYLYYESIKEKTFKQKLVL